MPDTERVELGVELLDRFEDAELTVSETIDRIETITTDPRTTREILEEAESRGIIERDGGLIRPTGSNYLSFEREIVSKDGDFTCMRCGASLSTGYFMNLETDELGPFGSSCIRKVTGRD